MTPVSTKPDYATIREGLNGRSIALVGLMGAGKTTVGRRIAALLGLPFSDSDQEIEDVSRMSVAELFSAYGEPEFRALEARVVSRLVQDGPRVLGTGGGAYMNPNTRLMLKNHAITVWLKADIDTLMARVSRRSNRPLLKTGSPRATMKKLMDVRYPIYAEADIVINSPREAKRDMVAEDAVDALSRHLFERARA
ncbi:shikimate kinase [Fulvimarina endophytica]|uniref:Shikimate kinase n=1 Tax=Fulvimarina endophytica TaxID=2293836 RepID=A0A371X128_9HYPH|nr:shikimate kinase [Fulvimarina endophytica]RFC62916.1 shikimate kinase [Fulvimarina endophytica]